MLILRIIALLVLFSLVSCTSTLVVRNCKEVGKDSSDDTIYECEK
jgi:hypothetical protein